jgi:glyoxylase-like metal-dependent hydrolase (beta-lactamase superfamily II)
VKLELYHWGPAHTNGDLIVYNPDAKVVSTGDIVVTNRADDNPNLHIDKNGSAEGWIANVKGMIGLNADTYVTGHGDIVTKADLQRKLAAVEARRDKVAAMVKQGKSLEEIKAALPDAPAPGARAAAPPAAPAAGGRGPAPGFVDVVYAELTKKKATT